MNDKPEIDPQVDQKPVVTTTSKDIRNVAYYHPKLTTEGFLDSPPDNLLPLDSPLFLQEVDLLRVWLRTQKKVKHPVLTSVEAARAVERWIQVYYPDNVPEVCTAALITACDLESFKVKRIGKTRDARVGISPTTVDRLRPPGWSENQARIHALFGRSMRW